MPSQRKCGKIEKLITKCLMSEQSTQEKGSHQTLGSGMIVFAWIIVLGMLTLYFGRFLEEQHNPNTDVISQSHSGTNEVLLLQNRQGHYVATGRINGVPVEFMLDTGATMVSIPEHIARKLGLKRGSDIDVMTANGMISVYATRLNEVALGNISLNNIRAAINPYMDDDSILLGMTFLKELEFTQRDGQLILRQHHF